MGVKTTGETLASKSSQAICEKHCLSAASFWNIENIVTKSAWHEHAPFAFWIIDVLRPRTVVELGTHAGFSYFSICQAIKQLKLSSKCFAIDTWKGDEHAGHYGEDVFSSVKNYNDKHYSNFSSLIRSKFIDAQPLFGDGTIDLLHIDGRHFYDDVKEDFESWRPKLSNRGVVLFHDTNVRERDFGVFQLWKELEEIYPSFEFHHCHGLGVLGYGEDLPPPVRLLFNAAKTEDDATLIRTIYARLGSSVRDQVKLSILHQEALHLKNSIHEANIEITGLNAHIQQNEENLTITERKLHQTQQIVSTLDVDLSVVREQIRQLKASRSWMITAPGRILKNWLFPR